MHSHYNYNNLRDSHKWLSLFFANHKSKKIIKKEMQNNGYNVLSVFLKKYLTNNLK